jgi:uncharacterized protein with beta-barrel porin domain
MGSAMQGRGLKRRAFTVAMAAAFCPISALHAMPHAATGLGGHADRRVLLPWDRTEIPAPMGVNIDEEGVERFGVTTAGGVATCLQKHAQIALNGRDNVGIATFGKAADTEVADALIYMRGPFSEGAAAKEGGRILLEKGHVISFGLLTKGVAARGEGSKIVARDLKILSGGDGATGAFALAGGLVELDGGSVSVVQGEDRLAGAFALQAGVGGATSLAADLRVDPYDGGTIRAKHLSINTGGPAAVGAMAGGQDVHGKRIYGRIELDHVKVNTDGPGSHVAEVRDGGSLLAKDSTFRSTGRGIVISGNGSVELRSTTLSSGGESLVSNFDAGGQMQDISLSGHSVLEQNDGTLLRVKRSEQGMDGVVHLSLGPGSRSLGDVVDLDGLDRYDESGRAGKTNVYLGEGAFWRGRANWLHGLIVGYGATLSSEEATLIGDLIGGAKSKLNFDNFSAIGGDVLLYSESETAFRNKAWIGGSLRARDAQVHFDKSATIEGDLEGDAAEIRFRDGGTISGNLELQNGTVVSAGPKTSPLVIRGDAVLNTDSILQGNFEVLGQLDASGGIINPGNSVETVEIGSFKKMPRIYVAEVNRAGESDLLVVKRGDVDLSPTHLTVSQEDGVGGYRINRDYTIVRTESGNIVGEFASAGLDATFDDTLVGLAPVAYNKQDVQVRLTVDSDKVAAKRAYLSRNQASTLSGVVSVAGANAPADAALLSAGLRDALNELSGEIHAGAQSALLYSAHQIRQAIAERVGHVAVSGGAHGPLWTHATGGRFTLRGDGNAASTHTRGGAIFVGADGQVGQDWRIGAALAYNDSATTLQNRASSKADVDSYTATLYTAKTLQRSTGQFDLLAGTAYTHHNINTKRQVRLGGAQTLKSKSDAHSTQVFAEAGYAANLGSESQAGPFVALAWTDLRSQGFKESGGAAALRGAASRDHTLATTVGVRGKTRIDIGSAQAFVRGGLGWRHTNGDLRPARALAFAEGEGNAFSVAGAPIAKNVAAVNLEVGAEVAKNATVGLSYNGQFGKGLVDNHGAVFLRLGF